MSKATQHIILCLMATMLVACSSTGAQRPSQRTRQTDTTDTTVVQMVDLNRRMAEEADRSLTYLAQEGYVLTDENYWVRGINIDDRTPVTTGERRLRLQIRQMDGSLIEDKQTNVQIEKSGLLPAIDDLLPLTRPGDSVQIVAPWYMAYGAIGNGRVKPYTNVQIELLIEE